MNTLYEIGDLVCIKSHIEYLRFPVYIYAIILGYNNPMETTLDIIKLQNMQIFDNEDSSILGYINKNINVTLALVDSSSKGLSKEVLSNSVNEIFKCSINNLNIETVTLRNILKVSYVTTIPNFSKYLLKNKITEDNNSDIKLNNLISKNKLLNIVSKQYRLVTENIPSKIELIEPEKIESRRFYVYKSAKVFRLYYCLTETKEEGTFVFYLLYNTTPDDSYIESEIRKILNNTNNLYFLSKQMTNKTIKPRLMNLKKQKLLEIKGIRINKQHVPFNDLYNLRNTCNLNDNFRDDID